MSERSTISRQERRPGTVTAAAVLTWVAGGFVALFGAALLIAARSGAGNLAWALARSAGVSSTASAEGYPMLGVVLLVVGLLPAVLAIAAAAWSVRHWTGPAARAIRAVDVPSNPFSANRAAAASRIRSRASGVSALPRMVSSGAAQGRWPAGARCCQPPAVHCCWASGARARAGAVCRAPITECLRRGRPVRRRASCAAPSRRGRWPTGP